MKGLPRCRGFRERCGLPAMTLQPAIVKRRPKKKPPRTGQPFPPSIYIGLMESIADYAVFIVDQEGRVADWNEPSRLVYGYSSSEIIGKPLSVLSPPDQVKSEDLVLRRVLAGERVHG